MSNFPRIRATAVDLFCGAGGLTRGLLNAGVAVAAGYDTDDTCRFPYEYNNPGAKFYNESITTLTASDLVRYYPKGHARILVGCAPCQTFSKYTQGVKNEEDPKWTLLKDFGRLVRELESVLNFRKLHQDDSSVTRTPISGRASVLLPDRGRKCETVVLQGVSTGVRDLAPDARIGKMKWQEKRH